MKFCIKCGRALDDLSNFCVSCGARQPLRPNTPPLSPQHSETMALVPLQESQVTKRRLKGEVPILVWSLILVPFLNIVGTPLGVIAALKCLRADAQGGEEGYCKLDTALYLCIVATVFDVGTIIFFLLRNYIFH